MTAKQDTQQFQAPMTGEEAAPAIQSQEEMQNLLFNHEAMNQLYQLAQVMASGKSTVPQHLQGNAGDCMAIIMQAAQWRMNPFAVAQKTHLVSGTLGYEAQLVNAVITTMAPTTERLQYEWFGDWGKVIGKFIEKQGRNGNYKAPGWSADDEEGLGVRVWATLKGENAPRELELLLTQAQTRNSTLWASDPKQQLAYLAIKRWARLYCPDVILGVYTPDEMDSQGQQAGERDVTPQSGQRNPAEPQGNTQNRARSRLRQKRQEVEQRQEPQGAAKTDQGTHSEPLNCAQVCEQIKQATTMAELNQAADLAQQLPEDDKGVARDAYEVRRSEIRQAAQ
ncbi:RecT family recombinase [Halomonas elongata]|uniref:RecT family recombinase n=1 Tax=Halomonas elongata TaxID=2746 RepID=UPI00298F2983|nr:RecT family recombinase [Halomonas elongata]